MNRCKGPTSDGWPEPDGISISRLLSNESTHTIDLDNLFPASLTETGSFDLRRIKQETLQKLLEAISVPTLLVAPNHAVTFANSSFVKLVKHQAGMISVTFSSLFPTPREARKAQLLLEKVFAERKPEVRETILKILDTRMWARIHLRTIRIEKDRFVLVQIENLTAQKQLRGIQKYKRLVNLFPIGIVELTVPRPLHYSSPINRLLDAILNAKIVDGNNEFAAMYNRLSISDLKGMRVGVLLPAGDRSTPLYEDWIKSSFPIRSFETRETTLKKATRYYENTFIANVGNRHLMGFWWLKRDISDKKRTEEEILRAQKLESLGTLAGGIAHDFNNLLTTILGNVTLAKNYLSPREKAFERMDAAAKAVERAQELTSQLLTFSRGGAPIKKTGSIGELLRDSVVFALRGSKIRHVFSIPEDLWAVEMDEAQIHQVIHNLILNAVQAMPEGGTVRVKAVNAELGGDHFVPLKDGRYVRIAVHDSGEGIAKEILEKIFDPYFTTKAAGTGLGLATAYSVVKKHGGLMTVKSKVGVGSVFYFYLPAASGKGRVGEVSSELPMSRKSRILVMDDDEMIRDLATELLFAMGLEAVSVQNGSEAVETYERELLLGRCFDAVIMDLTIPGGMGGKEALERLRTIDPSIKAIVSSGYSSDPIMSEYKKHGFMGVLAKPYQLSDFTALVEEILSEKKATIQDRP